MLLTAGLSPVAQDGDGAGVLAGGLRRLGRGRRGPAAPRSWWAWQLLLGTLLCRVKACVGSKRGLGFEESVELAGEVAGQAASDLAVGLALSPSPLGISAGG